jgi:riboflavin kinase/FMN adenylyltransferase
VENILFEPFTLDLAHLSADAFAQSILVAGLRARGIFVGRDFAFGRNRSGDIPFLQGWTQAQGIALHLEPLVERHGHKVGSTYIRHALEDGRVQEAAEGLGRNYSLKGTVRKGEGRGRLLGFPTANLIVDIRKVLPKQGVYVTHAEIDGKSYGSVTNIGIRPTFEGDHSVTIETHLLAATLDLYGKSIDLAFLERVREERKFSGKEELVAQIARDVEFAERYFLKK